MEEGTRLACPSQSCILITQDVENTYEVSSSLQSNWTLTWTLRSSYNLFPIWNLSSWQIKCAEGGKFMAWHLIICDEQILFSPWSSSRMICKAAHFHSCFSLHQTILNPWVYSFSFSILWLEFWRSWRQRKKNSDYLQEYLPYAWNKTSSTWYCSGPAVFILGKSQDSERAPGERRPSEVFGGGLKNHKDQLTHCTKGKKGVWDKLWLRDFVLLFFFFLLLVSLTSQSPKQLKS